MKLYDQHGRELIGEWTFDFAPSATKTSCKECGAEPGQCCNVWVVDEKHPDGGYSLKVSPVHVVRTVLQVARKRKDGGQ